MSSSNDAEQFFPPLLKWVSLSFFAGIFLLLAVSMQLSPQRIDSSRLESTDTTDPTPQAQNNQDESEQIAHETTIEVKREPTQTPAQTPNASPTPPANAPETKSSTSQNPNSQPPSNSKSTINGCDPGDIKGVTFKGQKFYYEIGRQKYYVIEKQAAVKLVECFKTVDAAIRNGYSRAPDYSTLINMIRGLSL